MAIPTNAAELKDYVFSLVGRVNAEAYTFFDSSIQMWTNELGDYPYWFNVITPATVSFFPISSSLPSAVVGDWVAPGWLKTTAGQAIYPIYSPFSDSASNTNSSYFHHAKAKSVLSVMEFDSEGKVCRHLEGLNQVAASPMVDLGVSGTPSYWDLVTKDGASYLVLYPKPQASCLYAVHFVEQDPPWFTLPSSTDLKNRWLTNAPLAVIYKCCQEIWSFWHEGVKADLYRQKLLGPTGAGRTVTGGDDGELARLQRETQSRYRQLDNNYNIKRGHLVNQMDPFHRPRRWNWL